MSAYAATMIAPDDLRRVFGHWATGIAIVTGNGPDGSPRGLAVNSFTSLSLDPPLILFAPAASSTTWPHIRATSRFAVNILSAEQAPLARSFARSGGDKFAGVALEYSDNGLPLLAGTMARLICEVEMVHAGGDHDIVVGRVLRAEEVEEATPLLFYRGRTIGTVEDLSAAPERGIT